MGLLYENSDDYSELLKKISLLNIQGNAYRYVKRVECVIAPNQKAIILGGLPDGSSSTREIKLILKSGDKCSLFWDDGLGDVFIDDLNGNKSIFDDYNDGGFILKVQSFTSPVIVDLLVRASTPINYQVGLENYQPMEEDMPINLDVSVIGSDKLLNIHTFYPGKEYFFNFIIASAEGNPFYNIDLQVYNPLYEMMVANSYYYGDPYEGQFLTLQSFVISEVNYNFSLKPSPNNCIYRFRSSNVDSNDNYTFQDWTIGGFSPVTTPEGGIISLSFNP